MITKEWFKTWSKAKPKHFEQVGDAKASQTTSLWKKQNPGLAKRREEAECTAKS